MRCRPHASLCAGSLITVWPAEMQATVAALLGSDLRGFDRFVHRLDALLAHPEPSQPDVFISTDAKSLACARHHGLLPRSSVRWFAESPDTAASILGAFGPLAQGVSPHHLHQWWRLKHAWHAMERHEQHRGQKYETVVRLRSDLRLPGALELAPTWAHELHGDARPTALVMRGDWLFWGARDAVGEAILGYVAALPAFHRIGQRAYMPLPYRHMVRVGAAGLGAGMYSWLRFPKQTPSRPFGFTPQIIGSTSGLLSHVKAHLTQLEALDARAVSKSESFSVRDAWWRWDGIPDNEKYFMYHTLNASLTPYPFLELYNRHVKAEQRVSFLGRSNGLLMPERHHPNCTCVCNVT